MNNEKPPANKFFIDNEDFWDSSFDEALESEIIGDPEFISGSQPFRQKLLNLFSDIEKRRSYCRKMEEQLAEIEKTYGEIVESACDMMYQTDRQGRFAMVNRAASRVTGFSDSELLGSHYLDIVRPDFREYVKLFYEKQSALKNPQTYFEFPIITRIGEELWVGQNVQTISRNGKICGFQAIVRDITGRKKAEKEREEIALKYEELFQNAHDFIYTHDLQGVYTSVNQASRNILGYEPEELLKMNFRDLVEDDYLSCVEENFRKKTQQESTVTGPYEVRVKTGDGNYRWVEVLSRTIMDGARPVGVHGSARDITSRKIAEEKLRESEAMYRTLFELANDSILLMDGEVFIDCNEKALRAFRCSREQIIGKSPWLFSPEIQPDGSLSIEKAASRIAAALDGHSQVFEWRHSAQDGKHFDAEVSLNRIELSGNSLLMAIVRDLTNRKKTEKERDSLQAQLTQSQKMEAIGTLAGGIAHDFNNLLQIILGYSDLMLMRTDKSDPDYEAVKAIRSASERGRDLVQRIMTFSSNNEAKLESIDLNSEVIRVTDLLSRTIPKMIDIRLDLEDKMPTILADVTQLEQIVLNLAVNAQHAMKFGGILTIKTALSVLDEAYCNSHPDIRPGKYALLKVSDTGHGMEKDVLERIFEPFFTTKKPGQGTGLGLAMVFGIVKSYYGHIVCSSKPNEGSSFSIYLPLTDREIKQNEKHDTGDFREGSETILVVDDEQSILDFVVELLSIVGYKVIASSSPLEALDIYRSNKDQISLVILDLIMPQMGGRECLTKMIGMNTDVSAIIASGYNFESDDRENLLEIARGFVRKPYRTDELLLQIRRILDN